MGDFAPKFAELNDDVLFGEVWSREEKLSLRDRSLVTVTALMAQGLTDSSFKYHLESAKKNGITKEEIAEILTHAAFYAGWPKAWAAFRMAKEVWSEKTDDRAMTKHAASMVFPIGAANDGFAQYFSGKSYLAPVSKEQVGIFNVTFGAGMPQQLAYPSRQNRRRANSCLRCRTRLLSGVGQGRRGAAAGRRREYSGRCQALARRSTGQLVLPSRRRGAGRGSVQRVAGSRKRYRLYQSNCEQGAQ